MLQVPTAQRDEALQRAARARPVGRTATSSASPTTRGVVEVWRDAKAVFSAPLRELHQAWDEVSWRIAQLRDNPACADSRARAGRPRRRSRACTSR